MYAWADGVYLQGRLEDEEWCVLVLIQTTPEGRKELLGFQMALRDGAQSWRELLEDIKGPGLGVAPECSWSATDLERQIGDECCDLRVFAAKIAA